jgi:hypothetical protein
MVTRVASGVVGIRVIRMCLGVLGAVHGDGESRYSGRCSVGSYEVDHVWIVGGRVQSGREAIQIALV